MTLTEPPTNSPQDVRSSSEDSEAKGYVLTRIIETSVLGVKAYHFACDCGEVSQRWDHESTAVTRARKHAEVHSP